jgi:hypothetical protein
VLLIILPFAWIFAMMGSKLFHDQQIAAGEHVRIWQREDGNLFEHLFPTGRSISIHCRTLDEARSLMAQFVQNDSKAES